MTDTKSTPEMQSVFSVPAGKLNDTQVKELQDKFGLKLHLQARSDALNTVLGRIGDVAVQNFDRTNPGYERIFDRTGDNNSLASQVINPVELEDRIRGIAQRVMTEKVQK
ncbi:hypothetical protein [Asticcacaulis solisilvae]|uniref:hypothetical protein n=1 Tax=Asticcacaulis solisilvae TaxID=1217274 RepID=UPI003FD6FF0F